MKVLVGIVIGSALGALMSLSLPSVQASFPFEVCGDLNHDGEITATDAVLLLQVATGVRRPPDCDIPCKGK